MKKLYKSPNISIFLMDSGELLTTSVEFGNENDNVGGYFDGWTNGEWQD